MFNFFRAFILSCALGVPGLAQAADPLVLEIQQVETMKRGIKTDTEQIFTLQTVAVPGSPIHIRAIVNGRAIELDGSLSAEMGLKLHGSSVQEMKNPPPGMEGHYEAQEFNLDKQTAVGTKEVIGEVTDGNGVYRLATYATLKKPATEPDLIETLKKHRK
jgi:hypothetical protein